MGKWLTKCGRFFTSPITLFVCPSVRQYLHPLDMAGTLAHGSLWRGVALVSSYFSVRKLFLFDLLFSLESQSIPFVE